jgi:hypothetical protein
MNWTPNVSAEYDTGTGFMLRSIWGSSNMEIYSVGDYGVIVYLHNGSWNVMDSGTANDLYDIWGMIEPAVATLLHSFSVEVERSQIVLRWSLSDYDPGTAFRVTRTSRGGSSPAFVDEDPALEREALSFTYLDRKVTPGDAYSYLVEQTDCAHWRVLFETGPVTVPTASIALEPNYPNPFNPVTMITYSVFERGRVTLRIYNVSGRLVRTLFDDEQAPGAHVIEWNGLDDGGHPVSSGTYFCRLTAGRESAAHKILLVR